MPPVISEYIDHLLEGRLRDPRRLALIKQYNVAKDGSMKEQIKAEYITLDKKSSTFPDQLQVILEVYKDAWDFQTVDKQ